MNTVLICPSCGQIIVQDDAKFCPNCGVDFSSQAVFEETSDVVVSQVHCQKCGAEVRPDYVVCPNCGESLRHTYQPQPKEQSASHSVSDLSAQMPESNDVPSLSVAETLKQTTMEEAVARLGPASRNGLIGKWTCVEGWFVKKKLLGGYDGFKATDVCWVYSKKVTQKTNFVTTGHSWSIGMKLRLGREVEIQCGSTEPKNHTPPQSLVQKMQRLQMAVPWAMFGFAPHLVECWKKNTAVFLNVVDKRIDAIEAGLRNGSLKLKPDGNLAVTIPYFTLPEISVRLEGDGRKAKRIYEAKG